MIKKNLKLCAILLIILTVVSSFSLCFADETNEVATDNNVAETTNETTTETTEEENIYQGDLYLFDSNIEMNQLVDGNVYIMGNNITVSGQVNGNLFVFGNSVNFNNCYIKSTIYACANNIYYNGACNDLYVAAQKLEMTYDSYVVRDVKSVANNTILKAAIGRDVDLQTNSIDFGAEQEVPIIYGNLRYSANEEKTLSDEIVKGDITYSAHNLISSNQSIGKNILNVVVTFLTMVITVLIIYTLLAKFKPKFVKELSNLSIIDIVKTFFVGLLTLCIGILVSAILLFTVVGVKLAFILASILTLIGLFAEPVVAIFVTNLLKPVLKIEKTILYYVVLALVTIILYGLTFIPFVGGFIGLIIFILGYSLILSNILPKKELSEEEIKQKLADKEAKKTLKAEKKAEKAKLKEAKKAEKESKKE